MVEQIMHAAIHPMVGESGGRRRRAVRRWVRRDITKGERRPRCLQDPRSWLDTLLDEDASPRRHRAGLTTRRSAVVLLDPSSTAALYSLCPKACLAQSTVCAIPHR